jgi:hypothetical protein
VEARAAALVKNGITLQDLERQKMDGYHLGVESAIGTVYAAMCLAAKENLHLEQNAIVELLRAVDDKVVNVLDHWELIDETLASTGIKLDFRDPLERVQAV